MTSEFHRLQLLLRCPGEVAWQDHQCLQNADDQRPNHEPASGDAASSAVSNSVVVYSNHQRINFEQLLQFQDVTYRTSRELIILSHSHVNPLKCSGIRCLHLKVFSAIQV